MQPRVFCHLNGHTSGHNLLQSRARVHRLRRRLRIHHSQPLRSRKRLSIRQIGHQSRRQKPRRLTQRERKPVKLRPALARALKRPFHRVRQVVLRVRNSQDPT